jgi:hypothetical protein
MRLLSRLAIVLTISLAVIALPSVPVQAICGGPAVHLVPGSGVPGTQLIVQGEHFDADKYVDVYYDGTLISEGTKTSASGDFSIPFTIPESCKGDHPIVVDVGTNSIGTIELKTSFYATQGLMVTPDKGPEGTTVTVTGHGFMKNEDGIELMYYTDEDSYQKVAEDIEADANGYWETSFDIPASDRGGHRIDARGNFSQTYDVKDVSFTVTASISLDKSSGGVGEGITMTGSRFGPYERDIQILFDGQPVATGIRADGDGDWDETFHVPGMAAGNHTVTAKGEYTSEQGVVGLSFEIRPDIVLAPDEGYVGMNVTVTGHGFAAEKNVSIMYDGSQRTTGTTDGRGDFEVSFSVPPSQHGDHEITIGYSATSAASATFTLESDPPDVPQLVSPSSGARVGFVGRVAAPTLQWSAVSDESGVYYNLQIATSPDVTAAGEFVNPMVAVKGLTATSYTATEALPHGTYYWIVQAVDGAQNQGDWTPPRSLRIGLMYLWVFIVIVVAIVVLIIALSRALVRRRRYYW